MPASESTKFQVNFNTPDGTLINLYAASKEELEGLLQTAQDFSALIGSVSQSLRGASAPAPIRSAAPVVVAAGAAPSCRHGGMSLKSGVSSKGKSWSGYMCAAPKGAIDKCDTIWA